MILPLTLSIGADSTPQESVFTQGTENGDFELLELLLKAPKKISDQAITRNLLTATVKGHFQLVLLFVSAGANANEGSALRCAVDTGRTDITTALLLCKNPPSPMSLDQALESLLTAPQGVVNNSYEMIEMLLCAGPEGNAVNEGLIKATFLANFDLMRLFLLHKADINYDRAAAVGYAIQKIRNDVVGLLLQDRQLRPELAAELVSKIPENTPSADKVAILSKLLVNGASGEQCSRLLIIAAEQNDLDTARLLVSKDLNGSQISSVDYSAGRSLQVAIAQSNLEMAKLLALEGSPSKFSLTKAFSSIPPKLSKDSHYMMVHALLQAGAEGPEVDAALYAAVTAQHKSTRLIELLVQHTATVSNDILSSAVKQGAVDIIKILLTGNMSAETCASGIDLAMKQHTHKLRYTIIKQLLGPASNTDLETPWIAQAVIDILQNCPQDIPLLRLLCCEGKANINLYDGLAVVIAAKHPDPRVLDIVLQSEGGLPNPATVESGLKCVTDLPLTDPHRRHKFDSLLTRTKPQQAIDKSLIKEIRSALAVKQDLGVIEALLAAGADVNSFDGAPVFWAVRDPAMTGLILSKRPNARSLSVGFQQAIKLSDPERYELCEKLLRAGAVGEDIDKALCIAAKEGATALPLLQLLLPHANVNYKDGRVLRLVVQQGFLAGLDLLLTPRSIMPLPAIKLSAFVEAMKIKNAEQRLPLVERLLKAGIPIPIVSDALISAANSSDFKLTQLLLEYNASVEQNGGQAIRCASSLGRTDILELLVKGRHGSKPTLSTLTSGFAGALAFKNKDPEVYYQILQILLGAGAPEEAMNPALVEAVREGDRNLRLSQLLYTKGASVEWNGGESLEIAVQSASTETLRLLLQKPPSQNVLKRAYRSTSTVSREQRLEIVGLLLDAGKTIDKHVANTLTNATRENPPDRHLVKLLLGHGVFDEGESMAHAATTLDLETLALLVDTPKATPFISCAFQDAMRTDLLWHSHKGLSIVELMLKSGAAGDAVGEALYCAVEKAESGNDDLKRDFLDTLLRHGADINYGRGRALQRAASQVHVALIQKLLPGATADTKAMALPYLFTKCEDSARVLKAIQAFNDSLSGDDEGTFFSFQHPDSQLEPVLFLALNKFPYKPQILRALLDTGYNPNQWKQDEWDESEGMEPWPLLCWALDQPKKKISNINIELIIDEGGKSD
jgi:ankyrin repeat protein